MPRSESYSTKARHEIMTFLKRNWSSTVSASDVLRFLTENGTPVNSTTVYRYLDKLCSDRIIIKYVANKGEKAVYQLSEDQHCADHLHLTCVKCGRIIHLDCGFMDEFKDHLQGHHNFQLQCKGSMLYGVCNSCASADKNK